MEIFANIVVQVGSEPAGLKICIPVVQMSCIYIKTEIKIKGKYNMADSGIYFFLIR
jgi:hypothetical protein